MQPTTMRVELALEPEAAELLRELVDAVAKPIVTNLDTLPAQTPYDLGLEPWTFRDPQQGCDVVAYLDPQNQIRHVPTTRATEVPKTWRRMWLEPRE